jgi:hypothetical protein
MRDGLLYDGGLMPMIQCQTSRNVCRHRRVDAFAHGHPSPNNKCINQARQYSSQITHLYHREQKRHHSAPATWKDRGGVKPQAQPISGGTFSHNFIASAPLRIIAVWFQGSKIHKHGDSCADCIWCEASAK